MLGGCRWIVRSSRVYLRHYVHVRHPRAVTGRPLQRWTSSSRRHLFRHGWTPVDSRCVHAVPPAVLRSFIVTEIPAQ